MLTHIVWWTFKSDVDGKSALESATMIKEGLEALRGNIPSLKDLKVSMEFLNSTTEEAQLILVTRHENQEGLAEYAAHPEHQKVVAQIKNVVATRKAIDFIE